MLKRIIRKKDVPDSLPIKTGVLGIPIFFSYPCEDFTAFKRRISEINHLLCLLDDVDITDLLSDIPNRQRVCTLLVWTANQAALSYAYDHDLLCEYQTAISAASASFCIGSANDEDTFLLAEDWAEGDTCITKDKGGNLIVTKASGS